MRVLQVRERKWIWKCFPSLWIKPMTWSTLGGLFFPSREDDFFFFFTEEKSPKWKISNAESSPVFGQELRPASHHWQVLEALTVALSTSKLAALLHFHKRYQMLLLLAVYFPLLFCLRCLWCAKRWISSFAGILWWAKFFCSVCSYHIGAAL